MDFGIFISAFDHTYDKMKNERKINPKEPSNHIKPTFCRELLCQIAKNENDVIFCRGNENGDPRNLKTFESYYRNGKRRSLHPIAVRIAYQPDREKFKRFLCSIIDHCGGNELLLHNFKDFLPKATAKTLLDNITREFIKILTDAAEEQNIYSSSSQEEPVPLQDETASLQVGSVSMQDKSAFSQDEVALSQEDSSSLQEKPVSSQDQPVLFQDKPVSSQDEPRISKSDLERIRQIIRELCVMIETLDELWPLSDSEQFMEQLENPSSTDPKVCEFNDMFKQFSKFDKEMLFFCRKYEHIKQFEPVKLLANTLNIFSFKSGFTRGVDSNGSPGIYVYQDPGLQEYSEALVELDRSLDNIY